MKIAILSTPTSALPPRGYAGIERVVDNLQKGLVQRGHDVTVFATGDSTISATLQYYYETALSPSAALTYNPYYFLNNVYHFFSLLEKEKFDIVHFNDAGRLSLYFARYTNTPFVTTLHGSYEVRTSDTYHVHAEKRKQLLLFKDYPYVSISNAQRQSLPELNYIGTVHNGIELIEYPFSVHSLEYSAWLGRVTATKGLDSAIQATKAANVGLKAYGFVDSGEQDYYINVIEPLLQQYPLATFHGELHNNKEKAAFLGSAKAFIMPIQWDEPFGLVMVESMACGTPVIAYARGAVPEVIKDGVTGFIINPSDDDIRGEYVIKQTGRAGLQEAIERIYSMSAEAYTRMRQACRAHVEQHFTVDKMVHGYETLYQKVVNDYKQL